MKHKHNWVLVEKMTISGAQSGMLYKFICPDCGKEKRVETRLMSDDIQEI